MSVKLKTFADACRQMGLEPSADGDLNELRSMVKQLDELCDIYGNGDEGVASAIAELDEVEGSD